MKTELKKTLAALLAVVMTFSVIFAAASLNVGASATEYKVGDNIIFGSYPQSEVIDYRLVKELNKLQLDWISYGYYCGTGNWADGLMHSEDYMMYADVSYNGEKYRAVTFTAYRPGGTGGLADADSSTQDDNGYKINNVYWFKYEPIEWRVLDPVTGYVMSETILDAQPFSNIVYYNGTSGYFNSLSSVASPGNFETSSIKEWLNGSFYNSAFSDEEKESFLLAREPIYLLYKKDAQNTELGFAPQIYDPNLKTTCTAYSKCQGLGSWENGEACWYLCNGGQAACHAAMVTEAGYIYIYNSANNISGIRPVTKIDLDSEYVVSAEESTTVPESTTIPSTAITSTTVPTTTSSASTENETDSFTGTTTTNNTIYGTYGLFEYKIENGEVTIISCASVNDDVGYVEIPTEIEGYPVVTLAPHSFLNAFGIKTLIIPNTVKTIGEWAFACDFGSIVIPASVTNLGDCVFANCNYLKTITVDTENPNYSNDEYGTLFNKDKTELICHPSKNSRTEYDVADSVEKIATHAFWNSQIKNVSIHENITQIGDYAFNLCNNLTKIEVDSENSVYFSDEYGVLFYKDKISLITYPIGNERTHYSIPETVVFIGAKAFEWAVNLESIDLSDKTAYIGYSAFYGCTSLKSIEIPEDVALIDESVFRLCTSLEKVVLPENLRAIITDAFMECSNLKEIALPDSLEEIGAGAFSDCIVLEYIIVPYSVYRIRDYAFSGCSSLEYVHIPETVTRIGEDILLEAENAYICSDTENCYAKTYADENRYEFRLCDNHGVPKPEITTRPETTVRPDPNSTVPSSETTTRMNETSTNKPTTRPVESTTKPVATTTPETTTKPVGALENPDSPVIDPELFDKDLIRTPSTTVINYADSIVLHADLSGYPEGAVVKWSMNNGNFVISSVSEDGLTCIITPEKSGDAIFTAIVYDKSGEVLGADTQEMTSKAGIFRKIIGFFKRIFGLTKIIPEAVKID